MHHSVVYRLALVVVLLVLAPAWVYRAPVAHALGAVGTQDFTVNFGDFQSKARLTYPADARGGSPTVILIHGQGPHDMDHTVILPGTTQPVSTIFKDIAAYFAPRGIAVLRFNKHYVSGPNEVDRAKFGQLTLPDQLADAEKVLAAARANPHVDARRIYIYGWSEGSLVAAALVARNPGVAGLILQGALARTDREYFTHDYTDVVLPYLLTFAPDGTITPMVLQQAQAGNGGWFAKGVMLDFTDPNSPDVIKVNPFFDTNKDGVLDVETEIRPNLGAWVDSQFQSGGVLASFHQLPSVSAQAPNIKTPVLVLQGENDASTRAASVGILDTAFAANPDYTLKRYPGLGHSLGPAASLIDDNLRPITAAPMDDTIAWLLARATRLPLPNTGVADSPVLFPATGYSLDGDFLAFWQANGSLPVFGYPIDSARQVDGQVVQWLERARFELHPENPAPYTVLLSRLGVEALQQQGRAWEQLPRASPGDRHYFAPTGHAIAFSPFWDYWRSHGLELDGRPGTSMAEALALFGYPISEPQVEMNADGAGVLTQWFERARFEYYPQNPVAYRVLLGRLGAEAQAGQPR